MKVRKGEIVNKSAIIKQGEFTKEEYEGLLAASDSENGIYNIALQLNENLVMIVDQVSDSEVQHRYHQLAPDIQKMQKEYKENPEGLKYI
ncbi:MAG: hypothetical protein GX808_03600 [Syntrophomonadaceae bacterium]|nr:hypothetical protein [Syntrophomonadaceae bacterium]